MTAFITRKLSPFVLLKICNLSLVENQRNQICCIYSSSDFQTYFSGLFVFLYLRKLLKINDTLSSYRVACCGYNVRGILGWICSIQSLVWPQSCYGNFCITIIFFLSFSPHPSDLAAEIQNCTKYKRPPIVRLNNVA